MLYAYPMAALTFIGNFLPFWPTFLLEFSFIQIVSLQHSVFPRVPFPACELACLVCTVLIKVVSI